ncbi:MAG: preprotein translocase subunit SecG [Alphaproteobacteria bacterium]|nr:preprotein translocase subunit SecG [Alphaproteobacteria bacterium]
MEQVLLVVQVLLAVVLIGMVLIQRSDADGFGLGGGGSGGNLLSGRAKANLMTRTTAILAGLFIINSLALSVIAARGHTPSIVEEITRQQSGRDAAPALPVQSTPPSVPAADADAPPAPVKKKSVAKKKPIGDSEATDPNAMTDSNQ